MSTGSVNTNPSQMNQYLDLTAILGQEGVDQIAGELLQFFNAANTEERVAGEPMNVAGVPIDPELAAPLIDPANIALILASLRDKVMSQQVRTTQERIQDDAASKKAMHEENLAKIQEFIDKMDEANKSGTIGKIFGWIGVVAMAIASIAVIAVGVATANPAMVAAGICLVAATAIMIAMMADQEAGGEGMAAFAEALGNSMQKSFGLSDEQAKMAGQILAMVLVTVVIIALSAPSAVIGIAGAAGGAAGAGGATASTAANSASTASTVASTASTASAATATAAQTTSAAANTVNTAVMVTAKLMQSIAQITGGLAQVGQGAAGITAAVQTSEASEAQADSKEIQALLQLLQGRIEDEAERVQELLEQINGTWEIVIGIIKNSADTASHIAQTVSA